MLRSNVGILASSKNNVIVPYVAEAVDFDGVNDYLSGNFVEPPASYGFIASFFWRPTGLSSRQTFLVTANSSPGGNSNGQIIVQWREDTNNIRVLGASVANGVVLDARFTQTINDNTWNHILVAVDMTDQNNTNVYINDILSTKSFTTFTNSQVDFNSFFMTSGGSFTQLPNGDLSEIYLINEYLDMSILANREKFIKDGKPVNLGSDGSLPTGTSPVIYFSGDAATWNAGINKGTGGNFTMAGAVTDSANEPIVVP